MKKIKNIISFLYLYINDNKKSIIEHILLAIIVWLMVFMCSSIISSKLVNIEDRLSSIETNWITVTIEP